MHLNLQCGWIIPESCAVDVCLGAKGLNATIERGFGNQKQEIPKISVIRDLVKHALILLVAQTTTATVSPPVAQDIELFCRIRIYQGV
ncbi:uncharacterized protein PHALS_00089 [Plasmopara halstedii]|uniref:Uncharacterized protein n=1 Tax=Plasmopara halstedii TaxID=4781 RepID=A0A0N7L3F8_PLAHL|nr:uncharacterized protein PHALS_00089 [Plasmopara halstedii]CEG35755.1 hypothetical protein PHALS_00089 [Plasmopara halstedii]|eukprot:XP_024572124.1 hypothetical protein PHALS_00089 [Plasmopara halstedii]